MPLRAEDLENLQTSIKQSKTPVNVTITPNRTPVAPGRPGSVPGEPSIRNAPGFLERVAERAGGFQSAQSPEGQASPWMRAAGNVMSGLNTIPAAVGEGVDTAAKAVGMPMSGDRTGSIFERFGQGRASPGDFAELGMFSPKAYGAVLRAPFQALRGMGNLSRDVAAGREAASAENAAFGQARPTPPGAPPRPMLALPPGRPPASEHAGVPLGRSPGFVLRPGEGGETRGPALKGGTPRPLEPRPIPMPEPTPKPLGAAPEPVTYGRPESTMPAPRETPMPAKPTVEHGAALESVAELIKKHRGSLRPEQLSQLNQLANTWNRLPEGTPEKQRALDMIYDMLYPMNFQ